MPRGPSTPVASSRRLWPFSFSAPKSQRPLYRSTQPQQGWSIDVVAAKKELRFSMSRCARLLAYRIDHKCKSLLIAFAGAVSALPAFQVHDPLMLSRS